MRRHDGFSVALGSLSVLLLCAATAVTLPGYAYADAGDSDPYGVATCHDKPKPAVVVCDCDVDMYGNWAFGSPCLNCDETNCTCVLDTTVRPNFRACVRPSIRPGGG